MPVLTLKMKINGNKVTKSRLSRSDFHLILVAYIPTGSVILISKHQGNKPKKLLIV